MRSDTNQSNDKYIQKRGILHDYTLRISGSENIEELTKNTIEASTAMIQPDLIVFGTVHLGVLRGNNYRPQSGKIGNIMGGGLPLDGPGIMMRAIRTKKTCNVPDIRKDSDYLHAHVIPRSAHVSQRGGEHSLSEIAVPIITHGKAMGVLNIENWDANAYTREDQEVLEALAGYAGLALGRIRYEDRLKSIHRYASRLVNAQNVGEIADYTLDSMVNSLELEVCEFLTVQDGILTSVSVKGLDETMQLREKVIEMTGDPRFVDASGLEFLSEIEVSVMVGAEVVASLSAKSIQPDRYTDQEKVLLETLASHVASAIQRIRLQEEQIQYEAKLEALHQHAIQLSKAEDIDEIADYTADAMRNTLGHKFGLFCMVETDYIRCLRSIGDYTYIPDPIPLDSLGLINKTVRTGETQFVKDTRLDKDYRTSGTKTLTELDVPLIIEDKVVGVLNIESMELNAFTEQDQILLETLANHVTSAIMRLQHYEERERVQQELALERVRVEQADELSRLKNQFISTATHELRTPVTSILGFLELVLDYSSQDLPDTVRKDLNIVFRNAMRLVDMTNDLLDVQRITSGRFEVNLEQVDLVNTLNEVVEEITLLFDEKQQVLTVDTPSELVLQVDETRISQLFINLLRNANKFTPAKGNIGVKVEPFESHVQISIKDSGIGLSEEDIEKLFKPFPAIRHGVNVSSTGLGLAICKGIVDVHMGVIWVESDGPGEGCTFIVRLPISQ